MRHLFTALLLASLLPAAAQAQEPAAADPIVLRVESGSVMVSQQGAEFATVQADATLQPDDRVLVPEGSVASLDYGGGCNVPLVTGSHPVAAACPPAASAAVAASAAEAPVSPVSPVASSATGPSTGVVVGVAAGVVGVAAIAGGGSSSDPPPVSR